MKHHGGKVIVVLVPRTAAGEGGGMEAIVVMEKMIVYVCLTIMLTKFRRTRVLKGFVVCRLTLMELRNGQKSTQGDWIGRTLHGARECSLSAASLLVHRFRGSCTNLLP